MWQEKAEASRVSAEAAELYSLLQTGKSERQAQLQGLSELRAENSALVQRVAELDAKNDDHERVLASVLSRSQGNGHQQWQNPDSLESGIRLSGSRHHINPLGGEYYLELSQPEPSHMTCRSYIFASVHPAEIRTGRSSSYLIAPGVNHSFLIFLALGEDCK